MYSSFISSLLLALPALALPSGPIEARQGSGKVQYGELALDEHVAWGLLLTLPWNSWSKHCRVLISAAVSMATATSSRPFRHCRTVVLPMASKMAPMFGEVLGLTTLQHRPDEPFLQR